MLIKYKGTAPRFKIMSYRFGADGFHEVQDVSEVDAVELLKRNEFEAVLFTVAEVVPSVTVSEIKTVEVQIETPRDTTKDEGTARLDDGTATEPAQPKPTVRRGRGRPRAGV